MKKNTFSLKGKIIVVTGATGLLGKQHCYAIASKGGMPILIDLDKSLLNIQIKKIKEEFNIKAKGYVIDITNETEIKKNSKIIKKDFGKIDGLINNAANNPKVDNSLEKNFSRLENFPSSMWDDDIAVGLKGAFLCSKYYGFIISNNKNGGVIINISSDLGLIAPDQRLYKLNALRNDLQPVKPVTYSVVKSGIIGLTRYLATYWADKNVRCNAICPGGVQNNQNKDFINKVKKRIPLNRMAQKHEYQGLLIFLLSQESSYVNGAIIPADGGRSVW